MTSPIVSRRHFLQGALACGSVLSLAPRIALASSDTPSGDTLVLVVLRGGLDGLSALVPVADGADYHDRRRGVAVPEGRALPVDGRFGLHPALAPLHDLYLDGIVALVPATGSLDPSRSHFDQQRILERGTRELVSGAPGWLSRHLATRQARPLQAVAGGAQLPEVLHGAPSAIAIPSLDQVIGRMRRAGDLTSGGTLLRAVSGEGPLGAAAATSAAAATALFAVPPGTGAATDYPADHGATALHDVARLLTAGVSIDAAVVDLGGWDLHGRMGDVDQGPMQARLAVLGRALTAFHEETSTLARPVTLVVVSEFGRTVAVNGSGGTDHGRGGLLIALGRHIRGGVHGSWPGLADDVLDDGDVPVTTDFRDPLAEIVSVRLANPDISTVFPGLEPSPLGLAAST